jgi:outer membrane lipoprotein-sorting protein
MIIALDVIPNEKNNIYDKLSILIDYNKGLITKFSIYRINQANTLELVQETAAVDFQKMPNGAWLPVKMTKNPNLTSGKLISTLVYSNLKNNQNLSDDTFDPSKQ